MTPLFIIGLVLSGLIGLSLGLIGGGGSILTVPILVYFLGVGPHEAVTMSLAVVGATSLLGSFLHYGKNNIDLRVGALFGASGIIGAFIGSPLTALVSSEVLLLSFGVLMLVVALLMIRRRNRTADNPEHRPHLVRFLIVPALVLFGGLDMRKAIGTSLFVIFLNCVAGLIGHLGKEVLDFGLTFVVMVLAVGGAVAGTMVSHRVAPRHLQKIFAGLVLGVGTFLVFKNYAIIFQN